LLDEEFVGEQYREMFEEYRSDMIVIPAERSIYTAIPPAHLRIKNFKRHDLEQFNSLKE
jgi:hypothetical protein